MSGGSKEVTVGYKYYVGMHMIVCHGPVDAVTAISVDGKNAWTGSAINQDITINADSLFGGTSREGGISGVVSIEGGGSTQGKNSYLQSKLGANIPAFRGVLGVVLKQVYTGLNPYLKPWAFKVKRILTRTDGQAQFHASAAAIGDDMNPAHIIYECLTDPVWGMGYTATDIDTASFMSVADSLKSEGFGLSIMWSQSVRIDEFIKGILKHIDGVLYVDSQTGLFKLKLMRGGYNVSTLKVLDETNIQKISNYKRTSTSELTNQVTVTYTNPETGDRNSMTVQDIALIQQNQAVVGVDIEYLGITKSSLASVVAARDLKALSTPLTKCTIYANRSAASLTAGDVFKLNWPRYEVENLIMRVATIEFGDIGSNVIKIEAIEDVFALGTAVYTSQGSTSWVNPVQPPVAVSKQRIVELTYYDIVRVLGDSNMGNISSTESLVAAFAERPSGALNARLYALGNSSSYSDYGILDFCPTATIPAMSKTDTLITVTNFIDSDQVTLNSYAYIDDEIVVVTAVNGNQITIGRGCIDTVPATHAAGSTIYFCQKYMATDEIEYTVGQSVNFKLLTTTGAGILPINSATALTISPQARHLYPYPPGNLRVNNLVNPSSITGTATVTWVHRSRTQQTTDVIYDTTYGSIGPEAGVAYKFRLKMGSDAFVEYDVSGTSYAISNPSKLALLLHMEGANDATVFNEVTGKVVTASGDARTRTNIYKMGSSSGFFDGVGDWLSIASHADFAIGANVNFTFESWVYPTSYGNATYGTCIFCSSANSATSVGLCIGWTGAGNYKIWGRNAADNNNIVSYSTPFNTIPLNTWTHIAVTRLGNVMYIFVNGANIVGVSALTDAFMSGGPCYIGAKHPSANESPLSGYMDETRLVTGKALYTAAFTPHTNPHPDTMQTPVIVEVQSIRDGLRSLQKLSHTFDLL